MTITVKDGLYECQAITSSISDAIEWLSERAKAYHFVGEFINSETGEIIKKGINIEKRYCANKGEAFMFASGEFFEMSSEFEIMASVEMVEEWEE